MVGMMVVPIRVMKILLAHCLKSNGTFYIRSVPPMSMEHGPRWWSILNSLG